MVRWCTHHTVQWCAVIHTILATTSSLIRLVIPFYIVLNLCHMSTPWCLHCANHFIKSQPYTAVVLEVRNRYVYPFCACTHYCIKNHHVPKEMSEHIPCIVVHMKCETCIEQHSDQGRGFSVQHIGRFLFLFQNLH